MPATERPNILWYCADQQRHDSIHALGNASIHTPNLDRLAENGVAFSQAYCQSPICTPSRASFLTGRYPATHQVHRNGNAYFPDSEVLVTRLLADAGYDCGLVGKLHLAGSEGEIEPRTDDGYRYFMWSHHPRPNIKGNLYADWLREEKGLDPIELFEPLTNAYGVGLPAELHQTTWCSEMAIRFVTENRNQPWLLSVNPFAPHPPFFPPQEYLNRYNPEDMPYPLFRVSDIEHQKAFRQIDQQTIDATNPLLAPGADDLDTFDPDVDRMGSAPPASYDARLMKACYYAEITLLDEQLGRIIDTLRETNQLDNTIVIFTSDHGELLGDHGLLYKGCRFFEALTHVPLIISGPGFNRNRHCDALVESIDLAPTLLESAGMEMPYYMQGKSLVPVLNGTTAASDHKPHVICEYHDALALGTMDTTDREYDASHGSMYFDGRYKIAVYHGHEIGEIYDLETDPGEFDNLWNDPDYSDLKLVLLKKHFDAFAATASAGVKRIKAY